MHSVLRGTQILRGFSFASARERKFISGINMVSGWRQRAPGRGISIALRRRAPVGIMPAGRDVFRWQRYGREAIPQPEQARWPILSPRRFVQDQVYRDIRFVHRSREKLFVR